MATVTTSTATVRRLSYPNLTNIVRDPRAGTVSGYQYAFVRNTTTTFNIWRSTDNGASWVARAGFTRSNLIEWSSVRLDANGYLHIAYRVSDTTDDRLFYRRYDTDTNGWENELQVTGNAGNGGVPGAALQGVDLAVRRNSNNTYSILVAGAYTVTGKYGVLVYGVSIPASAGSAYVNNGLITGNRTILVSGTAPGRSGVSVDIQHTGDGFTAASPHAWIAYGRTKVYLARLPWQGSTWQGPTTPVTIDATQPAADYVPARWDGQRFVMTALNSTDSTKLDVFERNAANSATTVRNPAAHPQGVIRAHTLTYDTSTRDLRLYAVGTTNATLYGIEYIRATGIWSSWAQVSADAITLNGTAPDEFNLRQGGNTGTTKFDILYTTGTVTPWTIKNISQSVQYNPSTPTWVTTGQPYVNGGAADINTTLTLDWNFIDVDPADTQASYVLRRQIGVAALAYWRASDSTWQATEQFNASATSAVTLPAAWGLDADANHQYAVKVRDAGGFDSPYSSVLSLIPSVKANPNITTPAAAAVITTNLVTVTWTVSQQKQFRIVLTTNPGGVVVHDTGYINDPAALSYTVPYELADNSGWSVSLTTTNTEGLVSTAHVRNFTTDYVEPATPTLVATPVTASGWISVAITNPAPSGGQPVLTGVDLYRRETAVADDGVPVARGLASGSTVNDWRAAARTAYQYRAVAYGVNGTMAASAWTS
jgi:hypothetical protein